jgi:Zn-dependent peptidase ImmA (M78 family)
MFLPDLTDLCAKSGVALVVLRTPKECKASGATLWISDSKAMMVISHRFKTDDHFWFSFFHEAGHLLLHRNRDVLVDFEDTTGIEEDEANAFAEGVIISPETRLQLRKLALKSKDLIRAARDLGISPVILVGQLHHEGILERNRFNKLKRRLVWE